MIPCRTRRSAAAAGAVDEGQLARDGQKVAEESVATVFYAVLQPRPLTAEPFIGRLRLLGTLLSPPLHNRTHSKLVLLLLRSRSLLCISVRILTDLIIVN